MSKPKLHRGRVKDPNVRGEMYKCQRLKVNKGMSEVKGTN
jgi:hypothetical protein